MLTREVVFEVNQSSPQVWDESTLKFLTMKSALASPQIIRRTECVPSGIVIGTTSLLFVVGHNRCTEVEMFFLSEVSRRSRKK